MYRLQILLVAWDLVCKLVHSRHLPIQQSEICLQAGKSYQYELEYEQSGVPYAVFIGGHLI